MEETEYSNSNECHVERSESGKDSEHQSNNRGNDNSNSNNNRTVKNWSNESSNKNSELVPLSYGGSIIDSNLIHEEESKDPNKTNIADRLSSKEETKVIENSHTKAHLPERFSKR